jgi:hypothetical protein
MRVWMKYPSASRRRLARRLAMTPGCVISTSSRRARRRRRRAQRGQRTRALRSWLEGHAGEADHPRVGPLTYRCSRRGCVEHAECRVDRR